MSGRMVQFGAGNIGRSFIGQLFARGGYEVVFVAVNPTLIAALNQRRSYRVVIKCDGRPDQELLVEGVRAVDGRDLDAVEREIAGSDIMATSVGQSALNAVFPALSSGLNRRFAEGPARPIDIIIAENIRGGAQLFRKQLSPSFPLPGRFDELVGLVETSIGKMVPIMRAEDVEQDPLWVFAEPYNTLIVDRAGFRGEPPQVDGIKPVDNIAAYVDRKLFIHNLGHAACAYLSYARDPSVTTIADAVRTPEVQAATRRAMLQSADALSLEYPDAYTADDLTDHVDDLLSRFANRALGDTIHRVGRDLYRKLGRQDRLIGAMLLAERRGLAYDAIIAAFFAALQFASPGPDGVLLPADSAFRSRELPRGLDMILRKVCGLDEKAPTDAAVAAAIRRFSGRDGD
ncbi:mannitol dehydrogenase family protein [Salinispira pacifica]